MIKKFLLVYVTMIFLTLLNRGLLAEDFFFEGEEIQVINNGEILKSNKGVKISSTGGVIITAQEFEYNKKNSELIVSINVIVDDKTNATVIKTNKIKYLKNLEEIQTFNDTEIEIEKNILIKTKNLVYLRNSGEIKSKYKTTVIDKYKNIFKTEDFIFNISNKILKGQNVKIEDKEGNISFFKNFFSNLGKNEFYGKDIKMNFSNKSFGNQFNEPRLYGNILESKNNITTVSKGIFTTGLNGLG